MFTDLRNVSFSPLSGSKAYNLHLLFQRGFNVPNGFSIFSTEFSRKELEESIDHIGGFPVAVRSSGQMEDLEGASFAGLYHTYLGVNNVPDLLTAINGCFDSSCGERVQKYLKQKELNVEKNDLKKSFSVFIQKMIDVKYAGVAFSINPLTGKENQFLIECCHGDGEKLVSGHVTPSQYIIDAFDYRIVSANSGGEKVSLPLNQILELGANIISIQAFFGQPQDIEWAIDQQDGLWILQSRPITSINWDRDVDEFTNADLKDGGISSRVCTPMMFSLYQKVFSLSMDQYMAKVGLVSRNNTIEWMIYRYGRVYWNVGATKRALFQIPGFDEELFDRDLGIQKKYGEEGPHKTNFGPRKIIKALWVLLRITREYRECKKMIESFKNEFEVADQHQKDCLKSISEMKDDFFFSSFINMINDYYLPTESNYFRVIYNNSNYQSEFKSALSKYNRKKNKKIKLIDLMIGLDDISHLEVQKDLYNLSRVPRQEYENERAVFLSKHYHHGDFELDLLTKRWGEQPEIIDSKIKEKLDDPSVMIAKQRAKYEQIFKIIESKKIKCRLKNLRYFLVGRERLREFSTRSYYVVRQYLLEMGKRIKQRGLIESSDDIFMWKLDELLHYCRTRECLKLEVVNYRYSIYQGYEQIEAPNEFGGMIQQRSKKSYREMVNGQMVYRGIGCSSGMVEGIARVVDSLANVDELLKGEILVTRFTDPGWTPTLGIVSAVVTEVGGVLSHAAVIGREYGIPAVLNIPGITREIKSGDTIVVDGDEGIVFIKEN